MSDERPCELIRLGVLPYAEGWELQRRLVSERTSNRRVDTLVLLEHDHVYTLGRQGDYAHLLVDSDELARLGASVFRIDRGGDITYHGPGQLVGYPILDLRPRGCDLHQYVRDVEEVIIRTIAGYGIVGERNPGYAGVWVGTDKIAAIGIRVSKWISSHGFALNVDPDLGYFDHIVPCGLHDRGVTSIAKLVGSQVSVEDVVPLVIEHFSHVFGYDLVRLGKPVTALAASPAAGRGAA